MGKAGRVWGRAAQRGTSRKDSRNPTFENHKKGTGETVRSEVMFSDLPRGRSNGLNAHNPRAGHQLCHVIMSERSSSAQPQSYTEVRSFPPRIHEHKHFELKPIWLARAAASRDRDIPVHTAGKDSATRCTTLYSAWWGTCVQSAQEACLLGEASTLNEERSARLLVGQNR